MSMTDIVGFLPAPTKAYARAADILEQSRFAYGVATSICVYEVDKLHLVCTLQGGHKATVTAVKWCPAYHTRDFAQPSHVRIASGDSDGSVVVWDVLTASQLARLDDVPAARDMLRDYAARTREYSSEREKDSSSAPSETGIASLAWVMPDSNVLAVVLAPALLLLWDVTTGSVLWKRELSSGSQLFGQLAVAPLDSRQISLCGSSGALVVLQLTDPARGKVAIKQYRVNTQLQESTKPSSSSLQALFPASPGLLVLLLPRELVLFDLQLGAPAASTQLPSNMPAFSHLLGAFGGGTCHGLAEGDGGLDFVYCAHVDGSLSVWVRVPGALKYKLGSSSRLIPPPIRGAASQVSLVMVKACLWRQLSASDGQATSAQTAASTAAITAQLNRSLAAMHLATLVQGTTAGPRRAEGASAASAGGAAGNKATLLSSQSLLVMAVTSDGRLWQWQVALPRYPRRSFVPNSDDQPISAVTSSSVQAARAAAAPATVMPQLAGLLHGLPGGITAMSLQPWPMLLPKHIGKLNSSIQQSSNTGRHASSQQQLQEESTEDPFAQLTGAGLQQTAGAASSATGGGNNPINAPAAAAGDGVCEDEICSQQPSAAECVVVGAAATSNGYIQVFSLQHGHINPVHVEVVSSHAVHRDVPVRGVRWVGSSPVLVSFSSEKSSSGSWKNSLMLTDVRTGKSLPFRDSGGSDTSPLLGIRVSPSGAYLLLVFKGAPTELWTTLPQLPAAAAAAAAAPSQADSRAPSQPTSRTSSKFALASTPAVAATAGAAGGVLSYVMTKPWRMRLLDLPFSAVEWVTAEDEMQQGLINVWSTDAGLEAAVAAAAASRPSPGAGADVPLDRRLSRQVSWGVGRALSALQLPSMSVAADTDAFPVEMLAFALVDGRSGVLSVRGRKVSDKQPKRPAPGERPSPGETAGTALACVWPLLVQGDADGGLLLWDLVTGRCNSLATGAFGQVRKLQVAPGSPPALSGALEAGLGASGSKSASNNGSERMRVAVLFSSGAFGVYEVDAAGRLRATAAHPSALARIGRAMDVSWVTMPGAAGAGSILAVVLEDGSLSLLDVAQCQAKRRSCKAKQALLHQVLRTPSAAQLAIGSASNASLAVVLAPPQPLGSGIMLQQPWVMLLRCLLQLGISQNALLYISSSSTEEDDDVHHELQQLLPRSARATLAHIAAAGNGNTGSLSSSNGIAQTTRRPDAAMAAARAASAASQLHGSSDRAEQLAKTKSSPLLKTPLIGAGNSSAAPVPASSSARLFAGADQQQGISSSQQASASSSSGRAAGDASAEQLVALGIKVDRFDGNLVKLLRHTAKLRGTGQLLHAHEWKAYTEALRSSSVAQRMAVAAQLSGHHDEAQFWSALPATLKSGVKPMLTAIQAAQQQLQQQQQEELARRSSLASAAPADAAHADFVAATVAALPSQLGTGSVTDSHALPELDHLDSLDDYDRMVQQALKSSSGGSSSGSSHRAPMERTRVAGKPAAAGGPRTTAGPSTGQGLTAAAAAPGPAAVTRRGSSVCMPGHVSATSTGPEQFSAGAAMKLAAADRPVLLLDEQLILSDAQERLLWHEALPAQLFEAEGALELRLLEYVVLGDFQTAVAFLLSTTPENSVRYYRSVVCALALAATASAHVHVASAARSTQPAAMLHQQAAKVVSAHAASIGDTLLGVPLNCSAGLNADAVQVLQEAGMWQFAASLIARTLTGTERAQALSRWANYVLQQEGSVWRCVGILTSAGCLSAAAQVLRGAGLPDCAQAYVLACKQAGLLVKPAAAVAALQQRQQQPAEQDSAAAAVTAARGQSPSLGEDDVIIAGALEEELELFDLLGQRTRMLPRAAGAAEREWVSGPDELTIIDSEYQSYLSMLLSSL